MRKAIKLARFAEKNGEVPVGAVIVSDTNQLLGTGFNQTISQCDPSAHAEVVALRRAARRVNNHRLKHTTMYVTLEPCLMCAGALIQARIQRLVIGTRDLKAGATGSVYNVLYALNHSIQLDEGVLQHECATLLVNFFQQLRNKST